MLYSRLVTKPMFLTHQCFCYWWTDLAHHQGFLSFSFCHFSENSGKDARRGWSRTADSNWPNGCHMAYGVMLSNKMCMFGWGVWEEGERFFQDSCYWGITLAGHESTGDERLFFFFSFSSLIELSVSWSVMYFLPFQFSPLFCLEGWFTC